jgi:hypothetical protein
MPHETSSIVRNVLLGIGLAVSITAFTLIAMATSVGPGGPTKGNDSLTALMIGTVALVVVARKERRHFWMTLIPFAVVIGSALAFLFPRGF